MAAPSGDLPGHPVTARQGAGGPGVPGALRGLVKGNIYGD